MRKAGHGPDPHRTPERQTPVANELMPLWAVSLRWELRRGRQIVLDGHVRDRWWVDGRPASFRELLAQVLVLQGAEVVGWWDPVDQLTFPVAGHRERFDQLVRGLSSQPAPAPEDGQDGREEAAGDSGTRRDRERRRRAEGMFAPRAPRRYSSLEDVTAVVRQLSASPDSATAFVFQDIDHALQPAGDRESQLGYLRLRAAMTDAVEPRPGPSSGPPPLARNAVLCAVGDIGRLPAWFHQDDPRVAALHISAPGPAERRLWLRLLRQEFSGGEGATGPEWEALVGATDGMTAWELAALARTSHIRREPVQRPDKLVRAHRLNVSVDPWTQLDRESVARAADELRTRVIGQDRAVEAVAGALQAAYVGVGFGDSGSSRPRGSFFFVGPTGVGKTELAKAVAQLIFGDQSAYARFDMSEYQQEHAAERLAGAPPGYLGYEQGGELTTRVQERPFSVLLFDEIEKAHPAVLDKFLQILEDGRLTDGRGQTANFSQCLIIFTSNTGADAVKDLLAERAADGEDVPYGLLVEHFEDAVERKFHEIRRPEIYGRLKPGVVVFDMLRTQHVTGITDRLLGQLAESVRERYQVELVHDRASVHKWITERMSDPTRQSYGGRQIRNELEALRAAVVRHFIERRPEAGSSLRLSVDADGVPLVAAGDGGGERA
nr:AAA family ATPase [Streptomyces coryli]